MSQKRSKKQRASASRTTIKDNKAQSFPPETPAHLYKYKSIDDNHPEYSSRIFTHNELYFCAPEAFNDPFDCKFQLSLSGPQSKRRQFSEKILKKRYPDLNRSERRTTFSREGKDVIQPDFEEKTRKLMFQELNKWGICCLSTVHDDILMWSHYANAHHGFCLAFSTQQGPVQFGVELPTEFVVPLPIKYSPQYPIVNPIVGKEMDKTLLTKAQQWKYEQEWRIITPKRNGPLPFSSQCLTGVIFGCKMSDEHKELIRAWCKERQPAITYCQARQSPNSYQLNIDEIP